MSRRRGCLWRFEAYPSAEGCLAVSDGHRPPKLMMVQSDHLRAEYAMPLLGSEVEN